MSTGRTPGNGAALPSTENVNSKPKTSLAWSLSVTEKGVRDGRQADRHENRDREPSRQPEREKM